MNHSRFIAHQVDKFASSGAVRSDSSTITESLYEPLSRIQGIIVFICGRLGNPTADKHV